MAAPTIQVSTSHYDAAESSREADYGSFFSSLYAEDFVFNSSIRALVLGRMRREIRNNPYLLGLVNKFPEAIGTSNLRSRTNDRAYNAAKDLFWFRYAKAVTVTGDSLRSVEDIVWRELLVAGEIFLVYLANGKIQLIPSEFCGSTESTAARTDLAGSEINGITYSSAGYPVSYRFGKMTPGGQFTYDTTPVDARYVRHIYAKDRVHMGRGLPWLIASLRPAHDLYEITRSKTKQIKDVNNLLGVIESDQVTQTLRGLETAAPGTDTESLAETINSPADAVSTTAQRTIKLAPGTFVGLNAGEKIHLLNQQYGATDYKELIMIMLHAVSAPVGLPVELWFSGLGDVNYSGFKGLGTQWDARRRHLLNFIEDRFLNPFHFWRISKAAKEGDLPPNPQGDDDLVEWAFRRTAILDEEKKARANQVKLQSGETDLSALWAEDGYYAEEIFEERRQLWVKLQIAAGLLDENLSPEQLAAVKVPELFLLRGLLASEQAPAAAPTPGRTPAPDASTKPSS